MYRKLAADVSFASFILQAVRSGKRRALNKLIRRCVVTPYLATVRLEIKRVQPRLSVSGEPVHGAQ
ncbi:MULTISPECIES: hypothetical protein [unclassified Paenibacillus]|uniref:hypothetical protein n=1 Tax=unclassified Paenibacillus TaxID=185978 RepID=UPI001AE352CA|nr:MULTISPECIES: hypothetical protein [unclassified Paenibacillus]MBP1157049.1 hypothetical protein [Paenibacillus sp. PvP091]MBP1172212.1 hypothetical protein [Paenibacillus sp. PvR098]MBP2438593.1 hypothetical protein [Paenibacillus sp. PvP052]